MPKRKLRIRSFEVMFRNTNRLKSVTIKYKSNFLMAEVYTAN